LKTQPTYPILETLKNNTLNSFTIPNNYWQKLTDQLNTQLTSHSVNCKNQYFQVPKNYFNELSSQVNTLIQIPPNNSFKVPDKFFKNQQEQISQHIKNKEQLSKTTSIYQIPENYFELLNAQILSQIDTTEIKKTKTQQTPRLTLFLNIRQSLKWAALFFLPIITIGLLYFLNTYKQGNRAKFTYSSTLELISEQVTTDDLISEITIQGSNATETIIKDNIIENIDIDSIEEEL
jgi:hypothetical protein